MDPYPTPLVKRLTIALCAFFIVAGCVFIPYAGTEDDECLFSEPLYSPVPANQRENLMVMPYVGALKTWLYKAIFRIARPSIWSVRVPVVLIGAATIWLLYLLVYRVAGARGALTACAILATDAVFLLTTTFDWGPVALQHILVTGGMLLAFLAWREGSRARLAWAFLLFGLGMWDKALCLWMLTGLGLGVLVAFPREVFRMLKWRNVGVAAGAFALGALPLIVYNVRKPLETFRGNASFSTEDFAGKARLLRWTLEGASLFGYMAQDDWVPPQKAPRTPFERTLVAVSRFLGEQRRSLQFWALVAALALAPLWRRRWRTMLFALVAMAVAWLAMVMNKGTGGGVHHIVLLWPLPQLMIGVAFAEASRAWLRGGRIALAVVVAIVCLANFAVLSRYASQFIRNGAAGVWTDALLPLRKAIEARQPANFLTADWGMYYSLRMFTRGRLNIWVGETPAVSESPTPADFAELKRELTVSNPIFIGHTAGFEVHRGIRDRLDAMAAKLGYRKRILETVPDSNGRPTFEILEYVSP